MNSADLTNLLLSLDGPQIETVRGLLDSRLMAQRSGKVRYPAFERLAQLTDNERYPLIREIPDLTLAEALKAGSEYLRWAVNIVSTKTRKEVIARIMRRLGRTRLSVAERAIDTVLAELGRQRESGTLTPALTDAETEQGLNAIRAGLPGDAAPQLQLPTETAEYLHEHLCGARDETLAGVLEDADPSDLALLLLQGRSALLTERLLTVGAFAYLREVFAAAHALQADGERPAPGCPALRLWQNMACELVCRESRALAPSPGITLTQSSEASAATPDADALGHGGIDVPKSAAQWRRERETEQSPWRHMLRRSRAAQLGKR